MTAILKTWPAFMAPKKVLQVFTSEWPIFYFTLGRGCPKKADQFTLSEVVNLAGAKGIDHLYFTHRGRILGHFEVEIIVQNVGQLPKLTAIDGTESEWQIRGDAWVAICLPPFHRLKEKIYHDGFRGWRYFDLEAYRGTLGSKVRL